MVASKATDGAKDRSYEEFIRGPNNEARADRSSRRSCVSDHSMRCRVGERAYPNRFMFHAKGGEDTCLSLIFFKRHVEFYGTIEETQKFLRFQLMLGTASPWLGQILVVFDVLFFVVGLPSIVSARLGFQDLVFGVLTSMLSFIARGRLHSLLISFRLSFPLYSCISLQLSSHLWLFSLSSCLPLVFWITFSFVYDMWAWNVILVLSLVFDFSVVVFHSPSLKLFLFFPCFPWYKCAELVS
ncbi:hypothetical protein F2Q69_00010155 [Brassica cretica]|uniref:Uncharacterized protein n=1 Tax=Brassica cretica TaxID=69181 RepID=A0A8S9P398_BRACR|nr:hypothetical protein F2Q69_00010155 [Brassica cretica]